VGSNCFGKWSEDDTWYRAEVLRSTGTGYLVRFVDYGNEEEVVREGIVLTRTEIPQEDLMDASVKSPIVSETPAVPVPEPSSYSHEKVIEIDEDPDEPSDPVPVSNEANVNSTKPHAEQGTSAVNDLSSRCTLASGNSCVAKWAEDGMWYRAVIQEIKDHSCIVLFVDYGNNEDVSKEFILESGDEIPMEDVSMIDEHVERSLVTVNSSPQDVAKSSLTDEKIAESNSSGKSLNVGSRVFARWSDDQVWYNAEIAGFVGHDCFEVVFVDYGNSTFVDSSSMVTDFSEIPDGEPVDSNVVDVNATKAPNVGVVQEKPKKSKANSKLSLETKCIAKWEKDSTWYNAEVTKVKSDSYKVLFVDYGNKAYVSPSNVVLAKSKIPSGEKIDDKVVDPPVDESKPLPNSPTTEETNISKDTVEPIAAESVTVLPIDVKTPEISAENAIVTSVSEVKESKEVMDVNINAMEGREDHSLIQGPNISLREGDSCVAKWSQDDTWYNAEILRIDYNSKFVDVLFVDYENLDKVHIDYVFKDINSVPVAKKLKVDPNVCGPHEGASKLPGPSPDPLQVHLHHILAVPVDGCLVLKEAASKVKIPGPISFCSLGEGGIIVVSTSENRIFHYSGGGEQLTDIPAPRPFAPSVYVTGLSNGGFALKDRIGFLIYSSDGQLQSEFTAPKLDTCFGLALDPEGPHLVTINRCLAGDTGAVTSPRTTDLMYVSLSTQKIVRRVQLEDILGEDADCVDLSLYEGRLTIVDRGLNRLVFIYKEDGEDAAMMIDEETYTRGFRNPSCVDVDSSGNLIVADDDTLHVLSADGDSIGEIKVPVAFLRPPRLLMDNYRGSLFLHNSLTQELTKFVIVNESL